MNNWDDRFYLFPRFSFNFTFVNTTDIVLAMTLVPEAGSRQRLRIATDRAMLRHIAQSLQPVEKNVNKFFGDVLKSGVIVIHVNPALQHKIRLCVPAVGEAT